MKNCNVEVSHQRNIRSVKVNTFCFRAKCVFSDYPKHTVLMVMLSNHTVY